MVYHMVSELEFLRRGGGGAGKSWSTKSSIPFRVAYGLAAGA